MRDEQDAAPYEETENATHATNTDATDTETSGEVIPLSGDDQATGDALSPEAMAWVRRTVADLGPLDEEEREFLAQMFKRNR